MLYIEIEVNPGPFQLRKTVFMRSLSIVDRNSRTDYS